MPLIHEDPKKLQKMQQELFLVFEKLFFPQMNKELPTGYVVGKYLYGMPDKKDTSFVKSSINQSLFDKSSSHKIISILMNREIECDDKKKTFKAMNVATMGGG